MKDNETENILAHPEIDLEHLSLLVTDKVDAMLAYWDKNLVCRFANKAYMDWFGKDPSEMIGKMTLPQLLGPSLYEINKVYIDGALGGIRQSFERDIITPLKGTRSSIANYYPHIDHGEVKGFFVHVADITTVKNLEKELLASLEREKMLNELKSRFVSMASHEFRTPLSTILLSLSLIEQYSKTGDQEKLQTHVRRIKSSVDNLTGILNDYLTLNNIEQNKVDVDYVQFNLRNFLVEIVQDMAGLLKSGQQIRYKHKGDEVIMQGKKLLKNVLLNLLSNAIKFSEKNEDILLHTEVKDNVVHIKVKDKGIGIAKEEQPNLFKSFFRAKNAVNIQGTGLGLTIVKRYVELLGGTVTLTSKIGKGTTVKVELPSINK